jgi:hypothetical protein
VTGQPLIEQIAQRHARSRRRRLRNLPAELVAQLDRRFLVLGRTGQHHLLAGHRILPTEQPDLVPAAALPDAGQVLRSLLPACHEKQGKPQNWTVSWTEIN